LFEQVFEDSYDNYRPNRNHILL